MIDPNIDELAKKIALDFNRSIRERVDALLALDCSMYTNLGIDSSDEERIKVHQTSSYIYKTINLLSFNPLVL
jgi:hypothetical protein